MRRVLANGLELEAFEGPPLGPGMTTASPEHVLAALEGFDPAMDWAKARELVKPLLPRRRPFPVDIPDRVTVMLPPGIAVGFGLDLGPAFAFVGEELMRSWGVDRLALTDVALANVRRIADGLDSRTVVRMSVHDIPVLALQSGMGISSTLLLAPDLVPRLFGRGPHMLLAPMRDLLLALPGDVDLDFAEWLSDEFEALDPNHLHLGGFLHENGAIVARPLGALPMLAS